jgi:hypothetical protein
VDPYRGGGDGSVMEAPTREGVLRLDLGPRTRLEHADKILLLDGDFITLEELTKKGKGKGKPTRTAKKTSERIGTRRILVARDVPREDLGVWIEVEDGVRRVFGAEPKDLISDDGLAALRALDAVAARLKIALAPFAHDARRAHELGRGLDKVLLVDFGEKLVLYKRELFADRARKACEVDADGNVVVFEKDREFKAVCRDRHHVSLLGDYIRFSDPTGLDLVRVSVPWVTREDREELARRFGDLLHVPTRTDGNFRLV